MDVVLAVYHSGHGDMESDGKFHVPLGYLGVDKAQELGLIK